MKKILKIGMIAATALPVSAIISCSDSESELVAGGSVPATVTPATVTPATAGATSYRAPYSLVATSKSNLDTALGAAEILTARPGSKPDLVIDAGSDASNQPAVTIKLFDACEWKRSVRIMSAVAKDIVDNAPTKIGISSGPAGKVGVIAKDLIEKFDEKGYTMLDVVVKSATVGTPDWKQYGIIVETPKVAALKEKLTRYNGKTVSEAFVKMFKSITGEEVTANSTDDDAWDTLDVMSVTVNELDHTQANFGVAEWDPNLVKSYIFELELVDPVVNEEHGILTRFSNLLIVDVAGTRATDFSADHGSGSGSLLKPVDNNNVGKYLWS